MRKIQLGRLIAMLACTILMGCDGLPPPQQLSAEIEFVREMGNDFMTGKNSSLEDATTGEVRDDLGELEGCWGTYFIHNQREAASVYRFDSATKAFELHIYHENMIPGLTSFVLNVGTYTVTAEDRLTVSLDTTTSSDLLTGVLITRPASATYYETRFELPMTLSGADLKVYYEAMENPPSPGGSTVYRRFDCSEIGLDSL